MRSQMWFCKVCKKRGEVSYEEHESDVMSVAYKLWDHHAEKSPECPMRDVQVLNPKVATQADIDEAMALQKVA